jgi:hypothetical protein
MRTASRIVRTTIDLPEPLLRSAKRRAEERKVTLSEIVGDALRAELFAKRPLETQPFELITVKGKPVPGIDLEHTAELLQAGDAAAFKSLEAKRKARRRQG